MADATGSAVNPSTTQPVLAAVAEYARSLRTGDAKARTLVSIADDLDAILAYAGIPQRWATTGVGEAEQQR